LASWARKEGATYFQKENAFSFLFQTNSPKISFLSKKNSFLGHDPKTKVVPKIVTCNFAKRSIVKIPIDFEIKI
jgi:hypothetical protein